MKTSERIKDIEHRLSNLERPTECVLKGEDIHFASRPNFEPIFAEGYLFPNGYCIKKEGDIWYLFYKGEKLPCQTNILIEQKLKLPVHITVSFAIA